MRHALTSIAAPMGGKGADLAGLGMGDCAILCGQKKWHRRSKYFRSYGVAGNNISTPDNAALAITGDIDIRVKLRLDDWTPASEPGIISQYAAGNIGWFFQISAGGGIYFRWSNNGSSVAGTLLKLTGIADGELYWVRAILDVDNGAGGWTATAYKSSDYDPVKQTGNWISCNSATGAGTTSIFNSSTPLVVGALPGYAGISGELHYAEIRNGINGPVALRFDANDAFESSANGSTWWGSVTGEPWTLNTTGSTPGKIELSPGRIA